MKLAVLGGGGVRSPFLAKSLALGAEATGITETVFMDINAQKLSLYGKIAKGIAARIAPTLRFSLTTDAEEALRDADYIITTIRAGDDDGRVFDERTALNLGVLGQETTGAGGFAMALRSIHVLRDYCELAKRVSKPNVEMFNFTNPSGPQGCSETHQEPKLIVSERCGIFRLTHHDSQCVDAIKIRSHLHVVSELWRIQLSL